MGKKVQSTFFIQSSLKLKFITSPWFLVMAIGPVTANQSQITCLSRCLIGSTGHIDRRKLRSFFLSTKGKIHLYCCHRTQASAQWWPHSGFWNLSTLVDFQGQNTSLYRIENSPVLNETLMLGHLSTAPNLPRRDYQSKWHRDNALRHPAKQTQVTSDSLSSAFLLYVWRGINHPQLTQPPTGPECL